jgi:hypothetical protein
LRALFNDGIERLLWLEGRVVPKVILSRLQDPVGLVYKMPFPTQREATKCINNGANQKVKSVKDDWEENSTSVEFDY